MNKKTAEIKRYTSYRQLLNGMVTIGALVVSGFIVADLSRLTDSAWVIGLLVVIGGIVKFEHVENLLLFDSRFFFCYTFPVCLVFLN